MSKSKGNVIDPIDLIDGIALEDLVAKRTAGMMQPKMAAKVEKATRKHFPEGIPGYGTDALRFTFYSLASTGRDIKFDIGRMEGYRNFCNKLWNAARYVLMNTENYVQAGHTPEYSLADRWIRSRIQRVTEETSASIESYRFDLASQALYDFVWNEYCDWYLELSKPMLWDEDASPSQQQGTRETLLLILEQILRLLHPLMPFITEEIWQSVAARLGMSRETIMLEAWPKRETALEDNAAESGVEWLKDMVTALRTIRAEANIGPSKPLAVLVDNANGEDKSRLAENGLYLRKLAKLVSIEAVSSDTSIPPSLSTLCRQMELHVPMDGVIDVEAERTRLNKDLAKLKAEVDRLEVKLANPNFADRAPADVVGAERNKQIAAEDALRKVKAQLERLKGLP